MRNKVAYLDIIEEKPVFVIKTDVQIESINLISLFRNKYKDEEILQEQTKLLSELDSLITKIKKILIFFSDGRLSLNTCNSSVVSTFSKQIIENEHDLDAYCTKLGVALSNKFAQTDINKITELNIFNEYEILYIYFYESNNIKTSSQINLGFRHVYEAINHFLLVFDLLLKIKNQINSFFISLLNNNIEINTEINNFLFQYEFLMLFDIFIHNSRENIIKYADLYGYSEIRDNYSTVCNNMSQIVFDFVFLNSNNGLLNKLDPIKTCVFYALENEFSNCLKDEKKNIYFFSDYLYNKYKNTYFVYYDNINNTYHFYYDDCMIDFNYISSLINGLKYMYYRYPIFLNSFINK